MRRLLYTVFSRCNSRALRHWRDLTECENLDSHGCEAVLQERLVRLLRHASSNVPYYSKLLERAGVTEGTRIRLESFAQVPALTKDLIRSNLEQLRSKDLSQRSWFYNTSGGSTGEPVRLIQDRGYQEWVAAAKLLFHGWTRCAPTSRKLILWGSERDIFGTRSWRTGLGRWVRNEVWINTFHITAAGWQSCCEQIQRLGNYHILAYAESAYDLARYAERHGIVVSRPESIMTSAGTLLPEMRATLVRVFGVQPFDRYGSREVGDIACECGEHEGLHVPPLTHYVEVLRSDGSTAAPGEVGEVAVTCLTNYAMPLIRYRIGDLAARMETPCGCGRSWPRLQKVVGRTTDVFTTSSGAQVHGEYFMHLAYFQDWIERCQFVQEDHNHVRCRIVLHSGYASDPKQYQPHLREMANKIRLTMGPDCQVDFDFVSQIEPTDSGKFRYVISKVPSTSVVLSQPVRSDAC